MMSARSGRHIAGSAILVLMIVLGLMVRPSSTAHAQDPLSPTQGDSDTFIDALASPSNPWVGQQVVYTFRYYEAQDAARLPNILAGAPDYKAPTFSNFWVEGDIEQKSYQTESNGRPYDVSELHTNLFPTVAGELTIDPAQLALSSVDPNGSRTLATRPVILNVRPLPAGAPDSFTGSVGNYRLSASVDTTNIQVDEPILLRLTLIGSGNIGMATPPAFPDMPGWRVVPTTSNVDVKVLDGVVGGTRTWDYQLIPSAPGELQLPAFEFIFFEPQSGVYQSARTVPMPLTVTGIAATATSAPATSEPASVPDQAAAAAPVQPSPTPVPASPTPEPSLPPPAAPVQSAPVQSAPAQNAQPVPTATAILIQPAAPTQPITATTEPTPEMAVLPASDARPETPLTIGGRGLASIALTGQPWFWALWALPVLAVVLTVTSTRRERRPARRQEKRKQARAAQDALHALSAGSAQQMGTADLCGAAQRVLDDYLSRKLGHPVAGQTRSAIATELSQRGVPPDLVAEVTICYKSAELARFDPTGVNPTAAASLQSQVHNTIQRLDKVLKP